jgi:hypothetical protein
VAPLLEAFLAATVDIPELAHVRRAILQVRGDPKGGLGGGPEPGQLLLLLLLLLLASMRRRTDDCIPSSTAPTVGRDR